MRLRRLLLEVQNDSAATARLKAPEVNYMGPESGPFHCGHCRFFDSSRGFCQHKEVQAYVEANGCCNEYQPSKK